MSRTAGSGRPILLPRVAHGAGNGRLAIGRPGWLGHRGSSGWGWGSHRGIRAAAFAAALLVADLGIALAIVEPRLHRLLLLGVAVVALALVFRFPMAATCFALVLLATVVEAQRFKIPFGPIELRLAEVVVGALCLVALVRPRRAWWGGFAGVALLAFLAVLTLSSYLTIESGRASFNLVYVTARAFVPLVLFFVIVRLFPEPERVTRLLVMSVALAAIAGVIAVLAAAPGSPVQEILNPDNSSTIRDREGFGIVNRVRLPGVALAYPLFWYTAVRTVHAERVQRLWWLTALAAMTVALALSFNRNQWIGLVLGLCCMLALSRVRARKSFVTALVLFATVGMGAVLAGTNISADSPVYPIVKRGTTLLDPQSEVRDSSLQDRVVESRLAIAAYKQHPFTGIGPGASFGSRSTSTDASGAVVRTEQNFLHNQYLFLLIIGGPLALLAFCAFLLAPAVSVLGRHDLDDGVVALAVGILLIMVSAIVSIAFADATSAAVVALLAGALVVLTQRPRPAGAPPEVRA